MPHKSEWFQRTAKRSRYALILLFALLAATISWVVTQVCFLETNVTTDESSYLFQSYAFRDGVLRRPKPLFADHISSRMMVARSEHGWFSRYPPGHALWLLPGTLLDWPRLMIHIAAALSVAVMSLLALQMGVPRLCMPLMLCLSPYFVFMYGTLLSHTSGFLAAALMLWTYLSWRRTERAHYAALAGVAWSLLLLNRTFTALLVAIPLGVDALVAVALKREWKVLKGVLLFAGCAVLGVALYLIYNAIMTGDPFLPTYLLCRPSEALGFGPRSVYGVNFMEHTFARGVAVMWRNLCYLDRGLFGFRGSLAVTVALALFGWSRRYTPMLLGGALSVWLGYIFFYFPGIQISGPVYYFESLPFLFLAASLGIKRVYRVLEGRPVVRRTVGIAAIVLMLIGSATQVRTEGARLRERCRYSRRILDTIASAPPNALVLLEGISQRPYLEELITNYRGLQSDPLIAHSMGVANTVLLRYFSDRAAFKIQGGNEAVLIPMPTPVPLVADLKVWEMLRLTGRSKLIAPEVAVRVANEAADAPGYLAFGVDEWIAPGNHRVEFMLSTSGVGAEDPVVLDVTADYGRRVLGSLKVDETHVDNVFAIYFVSSCYQRVEPRVRFGGVGTVTLKHIRIREMPAAEEGHE